MCEACGGTSSTPIAHKRALTILRCASCGLAFVWPQPPADAVRGLYAGNADYAITRQPELAASPDTHARDLDLKIKCIEYLDDRLVRHILDGLSARGIEAAVAVLPDHPTPVATGQHGRDPVPVAILRPGEAPDAAERYDEEAARRGSLGLMEGDGFMRRALGMER